MQTLVQQTVNGNPDFSNHCHCAMNICHSFDQLTIMYLHSGIISV